LMNSQTYYSLAYSLGFLFISTSIGAATPSPRSCRRDLYSM
jgi:hypothetical protein